MNWNIRTDPSKDRAVSPVIGVILMVAITVILAAVVGGTVMSTGSDTSATPQASLSFDYTDTSSDIVLTHKGGDELEKADLKVLRNGADITSESTVTFDGGTEITAGETITIGEDTNGQTAWSSGDTVKLVYTGQNGDSSVLATFEVP